MFFDSMFAKISSWKATNQEEFVSLSKKNPTISRWILVTANKVLNSNLGISNLGALAKKALNSTGGACVQASRRSQLRGYDIVVVVKDREAMRRVLIEIHKMQDIPSQAPFCLR
jgi:hypothetical protein